MYLIFNKHIDSYCGCVNKHWFYKFGREKTNLVHSIPAPSLIKNENLKNYAYHNFDYNRKKPVFGHRSTFLEGTTEEENNSGKVKTLD